MNTNVKRGFTLIELLIVIGILAVLATITVLVLNPAELFRQARDSQRISDLGSLKGAISLYLTTVSSPNLENNGAGGFTCAANYGSDKPILANPFALARTFVATPGATSSVDGTGWVRVDFTDIQGGSPLSVLPTDPNKTDLNYFYAYGCDQSSVTTPLTFEISANMESVRYSNGGTSADDVEGTDGGNQVSRYEVGTYPSLAF